MVPAISGWCRAALEVRASRDGLGHLGPLHWQPWVISQGKGDSRSPALFSQRGTLCIVELATTPFFVILPSLTVTALELRFIPQSTTLAHIRQASGPALQRLTCIGPIAAHTPTPSWNPSQQIPQLSTVLLLRLSLQRHSFHPLQPSLSSTNHPSPPRSRSATTAS